ncbi:MAG: hypothetical protein [Microviridae sp.]|nr:MAG: hypothetical protein [Microviridae sp.]
MLVHPRSDFSVANPQRLIDVAANLADLMELETEKHHGVDRSVDRWGRVVDWRPPGECGERAGGAEAAGVRGADVEHGDAAPCRGSEGSGSESDAGGYESARSVDAGGGSGEARGRDYAGGEHSFVVAPGEVRDRCDAFAGDEESFGCAGLERPGGEDQAGVGECVARGCYFEDVLRRGGASGCGAFESSAAEGAAGD